MSEEKIQYENNVTQTDVRAVLKLMEERTVKYVIDNVNEISDRKDQQRKVLACASIFGESGVTVLPYLVIRCHCASIFGNSDVSVLPYLVIAVSLCFHIW